MSSRDCICETGMTMHDLPASCPERLHPTLSEHVARCSIFEAKASKLSKCSQRCQVLTRPKSERALSPQVPGSATVPPEALSQPHRVTCHISPAGLQHLPTLTLFQDSKLRRLSMYLLVNPGQMLLSFAGAIV